MELFKDNIESWGKGNKNQKNVIGDAGCDIVRKVTHLVSDRYNQGIVSCMIDLKAQVSRFLETCIQLITWHISPLKILAG